MNRHSSDEVDNLVRAARHCYRLFGRWELAEGSTMWLARMWLNSALVPFSDTTTVEEEEKP